MRGKNAKLHVQDTKPGPGKGHVVYGVSRGVKSQVYTRRPCGGVRRKGGEVGWKLCFLIGAGVCLGVCVWGKVGAKLTLCGGTAAAVAKIAGFRWWYVATVGSRGWR